MKLLKVIGLVAAVMLLGASPAFAQGEHPSSIFLSGAGVGACLGMGVTIIGAGYGLGRIGSGALESMARQPEVATQAQTAMIIIAAMLEGATLASVVLCFVIGIVKSTF
jgi:F-type H+-transporting ATPase subunit c